MARLIAAAGAAGSLGGVALYPLLAGRREDWWLFVLAAAALLLLAVGLAGMPPAVGPAVAAAATEYVVWLAVDGRPLDGASPLVAAGLVLSSELAYRSLDVAGPAAAARGEDLRAWATAIVLAAAGAAAGLVLLAVAGAAPTGDRVLETVAAAAAVGALGVLAALVTRPLR